MNILKSRTRNFPPTAEANFGEGEGCKRDAYPLAYFLLTLAYLPAYYPAYLPSTGKHWRSPVTLIRLVLWVEKTIYYKPSCCFSQNQIEVNHNG